MATDIQKRSATLVSKAWLNVLCVWKFVAEYVDDYLAGQKWKKSIENHLQKQK